MLNNKKYSSIHIVELDIGLNSLKLQLLVFIKDVQHLVIKILLQLVHTFIQKNEFL